MDRTENNNGRAGKAELVRAMFADIAPSYDLLNHALSLNIDRRWRRYTIKKLEEKLRKPGALALDLCCGTGELSVALARIAPTLGVDFCHPMLERAREKAQGLGLPILLAEGDALRVPVADSSFDVVTMAFGLRNLESIEGGLSEVYRILRPGGQGAVLEFSHPGLPVFRDLFRFYFTRILPRIGKAVSGSGYAYRYLPESVNAFPDQETLASLMRTVGFSNVRYYNLFGGVAALHIGSRLQER